MAAKRTLVFLTVGWLVSFCGCSQAPEPRVSEEQIAFNTLVNQLLTPGKSSQVRLEAAQALLVSKAPGAVDCLRDVLKGQADSAVRIIVAKAIALSGGGDRAFVAPLMAMLKGPDASLRSPAAAALAVYHDDNVADELRRLASNVGQPKAVRLVAVSAVGGILDKESVGTLVSLLDDPDADLQRRAGDALVKLTNIRAFGTDAAQWKQWWARNRGRPREQWLADLAENLALARNAAEAENSRLRQRLSKAIEDVYAAASVQRRHVLLLSYVKDPLPEVRLVGLSLAARRLSADPQTIPAEVAAQIEASIEDEDPRVRRAAGLLASSLAGEQTVGLLLNRLRREKVQTVREGLLIAIGRLKDPRALPTVLQAVTSADTLTAAAAARALAGIVAKKPLTGDMKAKAVEVLSDRYRRNGSDSNGAQLREELVTAMGAIKDKTLADVLRRSLKDPVATVRLAAVNGLAQHGEPAYADYLVELRLTADDDRGIRQAAITALGTLDGARHLSRILERTRAKIEEDASVRKQAWSVVMSVLESADAQTLWAVSQLMDSRDDASEQRIKIDQLLVKRLALDKGNRLLQGRRRLARALLIGSRPAEAATELSGVYAALKKSGSGEAPAVWLEWVEALLAAGDVTAVKVMAEQEDSSSFNTACQHLEDSLRVFAAGDKHDRAVEISQRALKTLGKRLRQERQASITKILTAALEKQALEDMRRVAELASKLAGKDEAVVKAASEALKAMGDRAVLPLIAELERVVNSPKVDSEAEKAIAGILPQVAPQLPPYNPELPVADRLKVISAWRTQLIVPDSGA